MLEILSLQSELRLAQNRIEVEEQNRNDIQARREIAADSLQKYQLEILDLENNTEIAGELGPLQYLSGLTGTPMDKIINWLLLVIIFVFDPLAISLVVAANFAFAKAFPQKDEEIPIPDVLEDEEFDDWDAKESFNTELIEDVEVNEPEEVLTEEDIPFSNWDIEEAEKRMDIIGRNGNDGLHYEEESKKTSDKVNELEEEINSAHDEINELDRATVQIVDSIKHIDDYLKHHGPYYDKQGIKWDDVKLGFAEKDDYIDKRPLRSKPKRKEDEDNNTITY